MRSSPPHRQGVERTGVRGKRGGSLAQRQRVSGSPAAREGQAAATGVAGRRGRAWSGLAALSAAGGGPIPPSWPPARPAGGRRRLSALKRPWRP